MEAGTVVKNWQVSKTGVIRTHSSGLEIRPKVRRSPGSRGMSVAFVLNSTEELKGLVLPR